MFTLGQISAQVGPYTDLIKLASQISGVDIELIAAHIMAESSFNPNATHVDADGGISYGLMQVRLDTAQKILGQPNLTGDTLLDPKTNILAGTKVIQSNLQKYSLLDAIAAYNAGIPRKNAQGQYTNSKGDTGVQTYVDRVLGYYLKYRAGAPLESVGFDYTSLLWIIPSSLLILLIVTTFKRK